MFIRRGRGEPVFIQRGRGEPVFIQRDRGEPVCRGGPVFGSPPSRHGPRAVR
jgi:hypothetical protein